MKNRIVNVEEAERTLRLLAHTEAPVGLAVRVKARLEKAAESGEAEPRMGLLLRWPVKSHLWWKAALAASLLAAVAGGGWRAYRWLVPEPAVALRPAPPRPAVQQGGFSSAGAMRTPHTIEGPAAPADAAALPKTPELTAHPQKLKKTPLPAEKNALR